MSLRTRRFLPGEAIPLLAVRLLRPQKAGARSDISFLVKALVKFRVILDLTFIEMYYKALRLNKNKYSIIGVKLCGS